MAKAKTQKTTKTQPEPKINGRPSKYDPSFDQRLIKHMSQGLSFESFAAVIRVNQDTLHEWAKVHPSFSEAKKEAWSQSMLFYEQMGVAIMAGKVDKANVTAWIFNMKNRFKWRDVQPPDQDRAQSEAQKALDEALLKINKPETK